MRVHTHSFCRMRRQPCTRACSFASASASSLEVCFVLTLNSSSTRRCCCSSTSTAPARPALTHAALVLRKQHRIRQRQAALGVGVVHLHSLLGGEGRGQGARSGRGERSTTGP